MRRPTLALVLLALTPAGGFAQASYAHSDDLPTPPQLELCPLCFDAAANYFLQDLPPELEERLESPPLPTDPWINLRRLRQGQQIQVLDASSRKVSARFLGLTGAALELQVVGKPMTLAREDVVMVSLPPPSKAKRILLGILGGALPSLSAWADGDRLARNCWDDEGCDCEKERGLSTRSAVISSAAGAAVSGLAAGLVREDELVICFNGWENPNCQASPDQDLPPEEEGTPARGTSSAPASSGDDKAWKDIPHRIR
jgi:hypothetical protein